MDFSRFCLYREPSKTITLGPEEEIGLHQSVIQSTSLYSSVFFQPFFTVRQLI